MWTGQNVTVGESATEGRRSKYNKSSKAPCVFACGGFGDGENGSIRLNCVFVEQDGKVVVVGVGVELVRDM